MDFALLVATAVNEARDGGIAEIEVFEEYEGPDSQITLGMRITPLPPTLSGARGAKISGIWVDETRLGGDPI